MFSKRMMRSMFEFRKIGCVIFSLIHLSKQERGMEGTIAAEYKLVSNRIKKNGQNGRIDLNMIGNDLDLDYLHV